MNSPGDLFPRGVPWQRGKQSFREISSFEFLEASTVTERLPELWEPLAALWSLADHLSPSPLVHVLGHRLRVNSGAFSPDGKWVATGSADGTAQIWEVASGKAHGPRLEHAGPDDQGAVLPVAFSPDGKLLATGSKDGTARLWETVTGAPHCAPLAHDGWVTRLRFSPDGMLLLTKTGRSDGPGGSLREMQLRTWTQLDARRQGEGAHEVIPWQEWQALREELQALEGRK